MEVTTLDGGSVWKNFSEEEMFDPSAEGGEGASHGKRCSIRLFLSNCPGHLTKCSQAPSGLTVPSPYYTLLSVFMTSGTPRLSTRHSAQILAVPLPLPCPSSPGPGATNLLRRPHPQANRRLPAPVISCCNTHLTGCPSPSFTILLALLFFF